MDYVHFVPFFSASPGVIKNGGGLRSLFGNWKYLDENYSKTQKNKGEKGKSYEPWMRG
jgi:hypothetical protein